ncbi:ATP-dependent helicase [Phytohabitans suffuscus]|uniref:ATP-dependent helicase n=1 Tax=Phytohabitans suffuscus TaxID=624315 RepID=UPI001563FA6D|nr:ATP-dependent DNA helicase [Phytohabitans suffuscus]
MQAYRLVRRPAEAVPERLADPLQGHVVGHTDGPLLVVGGPGTGKTGTLVEAVAARVDEGTDPERILVLTFGRRPATRLRERIEARIAGGGDGRVVHEPLVRTFHAYAFGLLRRAAADRGEPSPRLLTGPEQDLVIRELLAEAEEKWPPGLRPALPTRAFAQQLRDLLQRAAERGVTPAHLAELGERLARPDWPAAASFLREYVAVLALRDATTRGSAGYDPAELIRAAVRLFADDPGLLEAERARLAYAYVDELADTDPAQIELLSLVAGGGKPLVAFADPDSSTFAFRGADPTGVSTFTHRFRTASGAVAPTVTLHTSYRTGSELLAATGRLARRLRGPAGHRRQVPAAEVTATVEVRTFRSGTSESGYVAHALRQAHLLGGVPWSRMAVLVRSTHLQLAPLQRALHAAGIPTVTQAEDLPLHLQPAVAPFLLLLRCALEPERLDEEAVVALLHSPLGGIDPLGERRLRQGLRALALAADDPRPSGELLVDALREPAELAAIERRWAAPAKAVAGLLATARDAAAAPAATVEDVLWAVWRASGMAERWYGLTARGGPVGDPGEERGLQWRGVAADRDLDAMVALFDTAARFVDRLPGARTEVFLDHVLGQQLPADTIAPSADRGQAVRLLTAHAAKGLEWDVVVVAGVQEGIWPDLRLRGSLLGSERLVDVLAGRADGTGVAASLVGQTSALLDEERRLFYVAATRARRRLLVTAVASASVGGSDHEEQPSRFLAELLPLDEPSDGSEVDGADPGPIELPVGRLPRALTLPALVAELRTAVADPAAPAARRRAAATELARLALAGVPGAHPHDWWGLRELSDDRPLVDEGEPVKVTPSTMESALRCSLRWLLERHGGGAPPGPAQGVGNLVHAAAMLAEDAAVDRERLVEYITGRFDAIELAARWLAGSEQARAESMVDKLLRWLATNPRRLLAIEQEFAVRLASADAGESSRPIDLTGRVDRLEVDESGRLVVIDLKTGKTSSVTEAELAEHPQLAAYQAAVEAGAFEEYGDESGGAALVQLGTTTKEAREQGQAALGEAEERGWAGALVRRTAETMAASTFHAVANSRCRVCPVRTSCPISGKGRQVVEP